MLSAADHTSPQGLTILTRQSCDRLGEGALTFLERAVVDVGLARRQHAAYRAAMAETGATVIDAPADDRFPDSTFVEDVLLAFPDCFVLCRPGTASRAGETHLIGPHLPQDRPLFSIDAPATLDGGDVLTIAREVFVGLSTRTNPAAHGALARLLEPFGYVVRSVPVTGSLHLKTAVTAPREDLIVANTAWVDPAAFGPRRLVEVHPEEPFAGNMLRIGERLFGQSCHPRTTARLEKAGMTVIPLDISEFAKVEAGLTCLSVVIPPAAPWTARPGADAARPPGRGRRRR